MADRRASDLSKRRVCNFHNTPRGCRRGDKCQYLHQLRDSGKATPQHEQANARNDPSRPPRIYDLQPSDRTTLNQWKRQIPLHIYGSAPLRHKLAPWIQNALKLVQNGPVEARQQVVKTLNTDGGYLRIAEIIDAVYTDEDDIIHAVQCLHTLAHPFMMILSDAEVVSSPMLERHVDEIHNWIYGTGGARATKLFAALGATFMNSIEASIDHSPEMAEALLAVLAVFHKVVDLNGGAKVNDGLYPAIEILSATLDAIPSPNHTFLTARAYDFLEKIQRRMGLGAALPEVEADVRLLQPTKLPSFDVGRDMPGGLSMEGSRHNNDHENIADIEIMPTKEEIESSRTEYLPLRDPRRLHLPGVEGLLDRHFRLLREDTVGQLRDAVRFEVQKLRQELGQPSAITQEQKGARVIIYRNIHLEDLSFDKEGLKIQVSFSQPIDVSKKSEKERQHWWEHSKCLLRDALICLVGASGSATFLCVCEDAKQAASRKLAPSRCPGFYENADRATATLRLVQPFEYDIRRIDSCFLAQGRESQVLCEFPGVLLPSFYHTLEALKRMSLNPALPLSHIIAPESTGHSVVNTIGPRYGREPNFSFDLSSLIDDREYLELHPGRRFDFQRLQDLSSLDDAQQTAVIDALTRELALIQGPPGTGKSFTGVALIRVLLANARKARLGPIICVCYTNHALDQLLEHLVKAGVEQIIRIGGRSKSEMLKPLNLRSVVMEMEDTPTERKVKYDLRQQVREQIEEIDRNLKNFKDAGSWQSLEAYLAMHDVQSAQELFTLAAGQTDSEGFTRVDHDRRNPLQKWLEPNWSSQNPQEVVGDVVAEQYRNYQMLQGSDDDMFAFNSGSNRLLEQLQGYRYRTSLFALSSTERATLYKHWTDEIRETLKDELAVLLQEFSHTREGLTECNQEQDLRCLKRANIVGVTTSGLAKNINLLRRLPSKVLVCEEAGEVLEAHILTALLPSIEHAILIGDHEQLRPQIQNYKLQSNNRRGEQYSLDVSLFERLINPAFPWCPQVPFSTLEIQRRMHPSIAELVRKPLYPSLKDHPSVTTYPQVRGVAKRLFWLDHQQLETSSEISTSHSNDYEVEMTAALVSHLVRQGEYESDEIAVLTPYLGQFVKIRKRLASMFEIVVDEKDAAELQKQGLDIEDEETIGATRVHRTTLLKALRMATVDNFQGEEAKVIIVSLVRSNRDKRCGFLSTSNRINVLLSRARHGMYLIGDSSCYRPIQMWEQVIDILKRDGNIGPALPLQCPRHPTDMIEVSTPDDFARKSPEGGCTRKCIERLPCGHSCINKCHSAPLHESVFCQHPCLKSHKECDHLCEKPCGAKCGNCEVLLKNVTLSCGHVQATMKCFIAQNPTLQRCQTLVPKTMPGCQHQLTVKCSTQLEPTTGTSTLAPTAVCTATCGASLPCGHACSKLCKECSKRDVDGSIVSTNHGTCQSVCGKKYSTCEHYCPDVCHRDKRDCLPCAAACEVRCAHSKCPKGCREPCAPCAERCGAGCEHHGYCELPCAVPCDNFPCSMRCVKAMSCGHRCPSVCGEECPSVASCQICCSDNVRAQMVDYEELAVYGDTDLDKTPCFVLPCNHIMTIASMDGVMGMSDHYEMQGHEVGGFHGQSKPFTVTLKDCPECRCPIRNIRRYNRILKRGLLDEATKKFISWSTSSFVPLSERLDKIEAYLADHPNTIESQMTEAPSTTSLDLSGPREAAITTIQGIPDLKARYRLIMRLRKAIHNFLHRVTEEEQPFGKVYQMVQSIRRQQNIEVNFERDETVLQTRQRLLATSLSLRCDLTILSDFLTCRSQDSGFIGKYDWRTLELRVAFDIARQECLNLRQDGLSRRSPMIEVQALIYFGRFVALERSTMPPQMRADIDNLREQAQMYLGECRSMCVRKPGQTRGLLDEVDSVETMLRGDTFYATVTTEEKRQVIAAMSVEFSVSGHWYYCPNGHPFTIGECGRAMQRSECPECGAIVGGQAHELASDNSRAEDLEAAFRGLNVRDV